mmetsp:Transcript_92060/g.288094  ORF Transcript_92060/g.288094 Transcript_92060/m.288094 type:complete len:250 (-) Transcript_92060:28-777(-)
MAVKDISLGFPAAEAGNGEQENESVREIAGCQCTTKSTFLYVVTPPPVFINRRSSSAPTSTSSSSNQSSRSDSSLLKSMDGLLQDRTGSDDPCEGSDLEDDDDVEGSPFSCLSAERAKKCPRACKGKRDRYRRFVRFVESSIRRNPHVDLLSFAVPGFIQRDERMHGRMMHRLTLVKERAMKQTHFPNTEDQNEVGEGAPAVGSTPNAAAKRVSFPGMRRTAEPEARRAAGSGQGRKPRRSPQQNIVSL